MDPLPGPQHDVDHGVPQADVGDDRVRRQKPVRCREDRVGGVAQHPLPGERVVGEIGLMIRDVKLSSKKMPVQWNPSIVLYPVNVTYLPVERDEDHSKDYVKAQMTMYINTDLDPYIKPEDVIKYCKKNVKNWIP